MSNLKTMAPDAAPTSEVDGQLNDLGNRLGYLTGLVESLEHRLTPVLSPVGSGATEGKATPREMLSPVSERVRASSEHVDILSARVQALLNSLAV